MKSLFESEQIKRFFDPPLSAALRARQQNATAEQTAALALRARAYVQSSNPRADHKKVDEDVKIIVHERLDRHRREIMPWLASFCRLDGLRVLEIGSGHGASTLSIAEQGAAVVATDVESDALEIATTRFAHAGLSLRTACVNAKDMGKAFAGEKFDMVLFSASVEHMTIQERIAALAAAKTLAPGGLIVIVETPNRLWFKDMHTSRLPFFDWLPNELAYEYARFSPRANFQDLYGGSASPESMEHFLRRGRGVSFHEFELGLGQRASMLKVRSSLQTWRRAMSSMRQLRWSASREGRFQSLLHSLTPDIHEGFFQPFLYLAIEAG